MSVLVRYENFLLAGALASYLAAMLYLWSQLFLKADDATPRAERWHARAGNLGRALVFVGVLLHLLSLVGQGDSLFTMRAGVAGLFGWLLAVAYLAFGRITGRESLGAFVTPVALLAAFYSLTAPPLHPAAPANLLKTQWLPVHVSIIVLAYVALAFAFAASLIYLIQETLLKRKKLTGLWLRLPSLQVADDLIQRATTFGLAMLTLGLLTGVVMMKEQPDALSGRDATVLFSVLTWIVFALNLAARWGLGWRGRKANLVVLCGFVLLVVSFFSASHIGSGQ